MVLKKSQIPTTALSMVAVYVEEKLLMKLQDCALTISVLKEGVISIKTPVQIIVCIINKH